MLITVNRTEKSADGTATIGDLAIDDSRICYSLEDTVREIAGQPVETWKIFGLTAIPSGEYDVAIDWSPSFGRFLIHILNVPGFDGVRVHSGNRPADTEGCVLVGLAHPARESFIASSAAALLQVQTRVEAALGLERVRVDALGHVLEYRTAHLAEVVRIRILNGFGEEGSNGNSVAGIPEIAAR